MAWRHAPTILGEETEMVVWKLKSCPKCGGDLYIDRDLDSWFSQCLQCSHWRELAGPADVHEPPVAAAVEGRIEQPVP